ncbi:ankyrin repeat-containing domain protein [Mycena crocata]|nr:ankyrin repeat-containing domain protein [Mycena crocata]
MADPISLVGLVGSILQFIDAIVKARDYVSGFKDAPKDQRDFLAEVDSIPPLLWELTTRLRTDTSLGVENGVQQFETPLIRLVVIMSEMHKKLGPKHRVAKVLDRLVWPLWGEKEVKKGLDAIERFKTLFGMWLEGRKEVNYTDAVPLVIGLWEAQRKNHSAVVVSHETTALQQKQANLAIVQSVEIASDGTISALNGVLEQQQRDRILLESLRGTAQKLETLRDDEQRDKVIQWWSPINFFTRQQDIFNVHQPRTGEWFLASDPFKAWVLGVGKTLHCHGIPGAGKTVLASIVVHHLRKTLTLPGNSGVAVLYLNHKETVIQSVGNLLASLWRQLVFRQPMTEKIHELYEEHREPGTRPSVDDIHRVLHSTVGEYSKIFLIVDALDEYPEVQRKSLLGKLSDLGPNINILLTSRPHVDVSNMFDDSQTLEIQATADDIRKYVNGQIDKSPQLFKHVKARPELRQTIETLSIERRSKLHITSVSTKPAVKAVFEALKHMPTDLHQTYKEVMQRINEQAEDNRNIAHTTLAWVSNAKRLLHISELREALAVEPGTCGLDPDNFLDMNFVVSVCAGLVIIDSSDDDFHFPTAQTDITTTCITYLSFKVFFDIPGQILRPMMLFNLEAISPFLAYAVDYCLIHARGKPESTIREVLLQFLATASRWTYIWVFRNNFRTRGIPSSTSRLWISTLFDLHLLSNKDNHDSSIALQAAAANNNKEMIRLLIANGVDVDARKGKSDGPALQLASYFGNKEVVALLIAEGADVNMKGGEYSTALQAAAAQGHDAVVVLLVEHGADSTLTGGIYGSALQSASYQGSAKVVHFLLQMHASIRGEGGSRLQLARDQGSVGTALRAAAIRGHQAVVRLLIDAAQGHDNIARLLLGSGAAFNRGHYNIVQLLLVNGAFFFEHEGRSILQAASRRGHEGVVSVFLATMDSRDLGWSDALRIAAVKGHSRIVTLLIGKGIDKHWNQQGLTALQYASRHGEEKAVRSLVESGADINTRGGDGSTALASASAKGHENVARLFLENGADIHVRFGRLGLTALHGASVSGHMNVVDLLIENGAEIKAGPEHDVSGFFLALHVACLVGHEDMVQLLLSHEADVNNVGGLLGTALQAATVAGHITIVQLLLDNGADVNVVGGYHGTALHAASQEGHRDLVQLLIDVGAFH